MSTSRVLTSLGIMSALCVLSLTLGGCVMDTSESDDAEEVMSADSPLGVAVGTGDDGNDVGAAADDVDLVRDFGESDAPVDPADVFGHEEEPDPVPWTPGKSSKDGSDTSNDEG